MSKSTDHISDLVAWVQYFQSSKDQIQGNIYFKNKKDFLEFKERCSCHVKPWLWHSKEPDTRYRINLRFKQPSFLKEQGFEFYE